MPGIAVINQVLERETDKHRGIYLDKQNYACEIAHHQCFALNDDGYPLHYDYGHYTVEGAKFMGRRIVDSGWLQPLERR
jgi:hypothetical protein